MEGRSLGILEDDQDMDEYWYSDNWIMEPISVGVRIQCHVDENEALGFLGKRKDYKRKETIYQLTEIIKDIKDCKLPKNTLFEGYITFDNDQQKVYKFLKSETLEDDCKNATFYVTDLMYLDDQPVFDMPLFDRRSKLKSLITESKTLKLQTGYTTRKKNVYLDMKDKFKVFIFKDLESIYTFNQSMFWRILKTPQSFFMSIMGFVESDDEKFRNMVMALKGGQIKDGMMTKIMNIPVHSNDNRIFLNNSKSEILGKVFEILALEKTKEGKYSEARFLKLRNDKALEDCIF